MVWVCESWEIPCLFTPQLELLKKKKNWLHESQLTGISEWKKKKRLLKPDAISFERRIWLDTVSFYPSLTWYLLTGSYLINRRQPSASQANVTFPWGWAPNLSGTICPETCVLCQPGACPVKPLPEPFHSQCQHLQHWGR